MPKTNSEYLYEELAHHELIIEGSLLNPFVRWIYYQYSVLHSARTNHEVCFNFQSCRYQINRNKQSSTHDGKVVVTEIATGRCYRK